MQHQSTSDSELYRLPRARKMMLITILACVFTNVVLIVVTIVRPAPQFSTSGVMLEITASNASSFSRRSLIPEVAEYEGPSPSLAPVTLAPRAATGDDEEEELCDVCEKHRKTITSVITLTPDAYHTTTTWVTKVTDVTRTRKAESTATRTQTAATVSATAVQDSVGADTFVAMWIGSLGLCLQRSSGTLVCTSASLSPNFAPVYSQSGLSSTVTSELPQSTNGTSAGLLISVLLYAASLLGYTFALSPATMVFTAFGNQRSLDTRHQHMLSITAFFAACAFFGVLASTIVLRNLFGKTVSAVPALDSTLTVSLSSGFQQLYGACVLGGIVLLSSMTLIAEDLRFPWWYSAVIQRQRNAWQGYAPGLNFTPSRGLEAVPVVAAPSTMPPGTLPTMPAVLPFSTPLPPVADAPYPYAGQPGTPWTAGMEYPGVYSRP